MDEVHREFKRAWAVDHKMTGTSRTGRWGRGRMKAADTGSTGWSAWATSSMTKRPPASKKRFDVVVTHMNPNGILFLWWLNENNPADVKAITCDGGWPIWASGLGRALAAYYAGSGDKRSADAGSGL